MKRTVEQQQAIQAKGASVIVSAAAGSGKTSVLVERLVRILSDYDDRCPAESLVVVTFTTDAAGEVRARLSAELKRAVQAAQDEEQLEWLRRQQTMLQCAKISTIHSFCFDLLREQFAQSDIPAGFRVMAETEEDSLRAEIAAAVIDDLSEQAEQDSDAAERLQLLFEAFCARDDQPLETLLINLYTLTEEIPFGEGLLREAAEKYQSGEMQKTALEICTEQAETAADYYQRAAELCGEWEIDQPKQLLAERQDIQDICAAGEAGELDKLKRCMDYKVGGQFRKTKAFTPEQWEQLKALRNAGKQIRDKELREKWSAALPYAEEDFARQGRLLEILSQLTADFSERLRAEKLSRGCLGFSDAMQMTLALLGERDAEGNIHKTALAEELSQKYQCIMVDEYQDTNDLQDMIFRLLSRDGDAAHYGNDLFLVGDSKQCIYGFRNANPKNFYRAVREGAEFAGTELTENTCIRLNRNFRSAGEVVDFVNCIFGQLMTEAVGEIDYDNTQELVQGAEYPADHRPTEILLLPDSKEEKADEAGAVADKIRMHLDRQTMVLDKQEGLRPCQPRDFLILLRTKTHMAEYAAALKAREIPVGQIERKSFLEAPEILLLLDILRVIDNPLPDIPAAAAMLTPMIGFSPDELSEVRLFDRKHSLYTAVWNICKAADEGKLPEQISEGLLKKCRAFSDFLEEMRLYAVMETPEQLIRRVYQQTDFLGMTQMTAEGAQKKANLRALLTYAQQYEESGGSGLSGFLRYIDGLRERGQELNSGDVPAGTENVVRIKTIHKSKGLEAPFVILAGTRGLFSMRDLQDAYQYHAETGLGFKLYDAKTMTRGESLSYRAVYTQRHKEAVSEEMRLLYVALTRARERIILPIVYSEKYADTLSGFAAVQDACGGQTETLTASVNNMRDWLMMVLIRNPGCEALRRAFELDCGTLPGQQAVSVTVETVVTIEESELEAETETEQDTAPDAAVCELAEQLKAQCEWEYDSKEARLTAKYGVSELAKAEDFSAPLRRPLFTREQHGLSGAERGTAVHTFLQYADFAAAEADVQPEIVRLRNMGRLTEKQAAAVEKSSVAEFFASPLYARVRAAKQVWREKKFTVRLSDLQLEGALSALKADYAGTEGMLIGIMDLVFEEEDGIVLVDYKTDRVQSEDILLEHYTEQIRLYAEALRLLMNKPVKECCLYSITLNRTVPVIL